VPNFSLHYAEGALATMYALRDISEGEELHLAYVSPTYELSERLASLWRHWGFVCTCRKCQDELMERVVADKSAAEGSQAAAEGGRAPARALRLSPAGAAAAATVAGVSPSSPAGTKVLAALTGAKPRPLPVYGPSPPPPAGSDGGSDAESGSGSEGDEDDDDEEDDSDECAAGEAAAASSGSSDDFEALAAEGRPRLGGPLGPRGVPATVANLEADLRTLMQVMQEDD